MSIADQFEHGRIPLRPLAYSKRNLAQTAELLIDYGKTGTENYHMYLADPNDPKKFIDLTETIANVIISQASINADNLSVTLEGEDEGIRLSDIINYIYKKYLYPENYDQFDYARDEYKLYDENALSTLLRDTEGRVILPVTYASNVFFENGNSIQDQLNKVSRVAILRSRIIIDGSTSYTFEYPYENYIDDVAVYLNGGLLNTDDYIITDNVDENGAYVNATIKFSSDLIINSEDTVDLVFTYNSKVSGDINEKYMDGKNISMRSIPTSRLANVSDSFTDTRSNCIASSKAVSDLFHNIVNAMSNNDQCIYSYDATGNDRLITISSNKRIIDYDYCLCNVLLANTKRYDSRVAFVHNRETIANVVMVDSNGNDIKNALPKGKMAKIMWVRELAKCILISIDLSQIHMSRWLYKAVDNSTEICFCDMSYEIGSHISVYRDGKRLFEDIDYYMDSANETITLFNAAIPGETFVFEALYL